MSKVSNTDKPSGIERRVHRLWYCVGMGLVAGAYVMALPVPPQQIVGFSVPVVLLVLGLIGFLARRYSASLFSARLRRGKGTIVYLVALGIVLVGGLVLVVVVVRHGDALWLAWTMAGLIFAVVASGAWITEGPSTRKMASAP